MTLPVFPNDVTSLLDDCYYGPGKYVNDNNDNRPIRTVGSTEFRGGFRIRLKKGGALASMRVRHQSGDVGDGSGKGYSSGVNPTLTYKIYPATLQGGLMLPDRTGGALSTGTNAFAMGGPGGGEITTQAGKSPLITMSAHTFADGDWIWVEVSNTSGDPVNNWISTNGSCAISQNVTAVKFNPLSNWSYVYESITGGVHTYDEYSGPTSLTANLLIFPDCEFHFTGGLVEGNARGEPGNFTNAGGTSDGTDPDFLFPIKGARVIQEKFTAIKAGTVVGYAIQCAAAVAGTITGTLSIAGQTPVSNNITEAVANYATTSPNANGILKWEFVELATPIVVPSPAAATLSFKATGSADFRTPMDRSGLDSSFNFNVAATGGDSSGQYAIAGTTFVNPIYFNHTAEQGFGTSHMRVVLIYALVGGGGGGGGVGGGLLEIISYPGSHAVAGSAAYQNLEVTGDESGTKGALPFTVSLVPFANTNEAWVHVVDYLPLSILDAYPDYYQTHYEVPGSDPSGNTYGGWSRDAPKGRPTIGTGYQVADWVTWINEVKAGGADAFTMDLTSIPDTGGNSAWGYSLTACASVGGTFKMIPTLDCDSGVWNGTTIAAFLATWWTNTNIRKVGGKMVIAAYDCESAGDSTFWSGVVTAAAAAGHPISFWPMFAGIDNHHAPFMSFSDGAGWWGLSDIVSLAAQKTFYQTFRTTYATKGLMAIARPQFYSPRAARGGSNFGMYWEGQGSNLYRQMAQMAIDVGATVLLGATWNDVAEHTHLMPAENTNFIFYTLMAYYNVAFRTGSFPIINQDKLFHFYRTQATTLVPSTQVTAALAALQGSTSADNEIECLGFLTDAGVIEINNGTAIQTSVGAGVQSVKVPLTTGTPTFRLLRGTSSSGSVVPLSGNLSRTSADYLRVVGPLKDRIDSLQNVNPGDGHNVFALRYRAPTSANLTNYRVTLARGAGYSLGTEGTLRVRVYPCDGSNKPNQAVAALATHSLTTLGSATVIDISLNAAQVAGQLYAIVVDNTDAAPLTNYVGIENVDTTHQNGRPNQWIDPLEWGSLFGVDAGGAPSVWNDMSVNSLSSENFLYVMPIAMLTFADATNIGCGTQVSGNVDSNRVYTFTSADEWGEFFTLPAPQQFSGLIFEAAASVAGTLGWRLADASGTTVVDTSGATLSGTIVSSGIDYTTGTDPGYAVGVYKQNSIPFLGITPNLQNFSIRFKPVSGSWKEAAFMDGRSAGYPYPTSFSYSISQRFYSGAWIRVGARPDLGQDVTDGAYDSHWRVAMFASPSGVVPPPPPGVTPIFGFADARQGGGSAIAAGALATTNIAPIDFTGAIAPIGVWTQWGANGLAVESDGGLRALVASAESIDYTKIPNIAPMRVRLSEMTVNDGYFSMVIGAATTAGLMNGSDTSTVGVTLYSGDGVMTCRFWQNNGSGGLVELGSNAWFVPRTNGADFEFVITPDITNRVYRVTAFNPDGTSVPWMGSGLGTPPVELVSNALVAMPVGQILGVMIAPGSAAGPGTMKAKVLYFNWRASGPAAGTIVISPATPTVSGQTVTISGVVSPPTGATQATISVVQSAVVVASATVAINQSTGAYSGTVVTPVPGVIGTRTVVGSTTQDGAPLTIRKLSGNVQA